MPPNPTETRLALVAPYGSKVRYETRKESGTGTLALVWYGVSEVANVRRDDGSTIYVYPELGETLTLVGGSG